MKIQLSKYALMGNPVSHSKSPFIHQYFAKQLNIDLTYEAILVPLQGFRESLVVFQKQGGKGLNITLPFKQQAFMLMDKLGKVAIKAGAVNTVVFYPDGTRLGENTDGIGFLRDFVENHHGEIANKKILLLGAGGAARGVLGPILSQVPECVVIANRTPCKVEVLIQDFSKYGVVLSGASEKNEKLDFDIIINSTSASLENSVPDTITPSLFRKKVWCYDMAYKDEPTSFLMFAKAQGAIHSMDGLGMLVEQAAESFFLWHGVKPETQDLINQLRENTRRN